MPPKQLPGGLPGQRYITPPELDGVTLFYSSQWRQKKLQSRMATMWMLEHGMLPEALANRLHMIGSDWDIEDVEDYLPKFKFNFTPVIKPTIEDIKPKKKIVKVKKPIIRKTAIKPIQKSVTVCKFKFPIPKVIKVKVKSPEQIKARVKFNFKPVIQTTVRPKFNFKPAIKC